jgi:hypothetical protein
LTDYVLYTSSGLQRTPLSSIFIRNLAFHPYLPQFHQQRRGYRLQIQVANHFITGSIMLFDKMEPQRLTGPIFNDTSTRGKEKANVWK